MQHETSPPVSVFIPAYNAERFIGAAIESVLTQTFRDFELLIIDDGSTDATPMIAQGYTSDPRVRVIHHERNQGRSRTRNEGLDNTHGTYIALLDADDICMPGRLERQVSYLATHTDITVLGSHDHRIDAEGHRLPDKRRQRYLHPAGIAAEMLFRCPVHQPTIMARRKALASYRYDPDRSGAEDYDLWSRMSTTHAFANLPDALISYRRHPAQSTQVGVAAINQDYKHIHATQLAVLGIEPTEQDLQRHRLLSGGANYYRRETGQPMDRAYIIWAESWLRRLIAANAETGRYSEPAFSRVIGRLWTQLCRKAARPRAAGLGVWPAFVRSPLKKAVATAWLQSKASS